MVFHRVEPSRTPDDEVIAGEAPCTAHRTAVVRISPHRIGIDAVHDDRNTIGRQSTPDRVGAHGPRIGNGEVGAPRKPCF
jgi:hypothetical protein